MLKVLSKNVVVTSVPVTEDTPLFCQSMRNALFLGKVRLNKAK